MEQNNEILSIFTQEGENGKSVMDDLVTVFLRLWEAIGPLTERFATWVAGLAEAAEAATDTKKEMEELTAFFDRAGERAAGFGEIFSSMFSLFGTLAEAAQPAIDMMMTYTLDAFNSMGASADENFQRIQDWFIQTAETSQAILDFAGALVLEFLKLGENDGVREMFEILTNGTEDSQSLVTSLGDIAEAFADSGPALASLSTTWPRQFRFSPRAGRLKGSSMSSTSSLSH